MDALDRSRLDEAAKRGPIAWQEERVAQAARGIRERTIPTRRPNPGPTATAAGKLVAGLLATAVVIGSATLAVMAAKGFWQVVRSV